MSPCVATTENAPCTRNWACPTATVSPCAVPGAPVAVVVHGVFQLGSAVAEADELLDAGTADAVSPSSWIVPGCVVCTK